VRGGRLKTGENEPEGDLFRWRADRRQVVLQKRETQKGVKLRFERKPVEWGIRKEKNALTKGLPIEATQNTTIAPCNCEE